MSDLPIVWRTAARVVLVDLDGRVLLLQGGDPDRVEDVYWYTTGGGLDDGETPEQAGRREVREETGLVLEDLGPQVRETDSVFVFEGREVHQHDVFFIVRLDRRVAGLDRSGWSDLERRSITAHRWWTRAELATTPERYYPADLLDLLSRRDVAS